MTALCLLPVIGLCLTAPSLPAVAASEAQGTPGAQLAQNLLAIEQLEDEFLVLIDTDVYQRPDTSSARIEQLEGGSVVLVTGRVTSADWYRVWTDAGSLGYVERDYVKPMLPAAKPEDVMAAVVVPERPAVLTPIEPAVGVFEGPSDLPPVEPGLADSVFRDCHDCPQMVRIAVGRFTMGSVSDPTEQPVHAVEIAKPFALGRFEVTLTQWQACVAAGACDYEPDAGSRPEWTAVRHLSWDDAEQYVAWLAKVTGKPYRLPSEAEWEYAARAGTETAYWWGAEAGEANADCKTCGGVWNRKSPGLIGQRKPNPFGLHDMNGGVAEWTADCWFTSYKGAPVDGSARGKRNCQQRVLRGGSWRNEADYLRSAARMYYDAFVQYGAHGLRVALTLE